MSIRRYSPGGDVRDVRPVLVIGADARLKARQDRGDVGLAGARDGLRGVVVDFWRRCLRREYWQQRRGEHTRGHRAPQRHTAYLVRDLNTRSCRVGDAVVRKLSLIHI